MIQEIKKQNQKSSFFNSIFSCCFESKQQKSNLIKLKKGVVQKTKVESLSSSISLQSNEEKEEKEEKEGKNKEISNEDLYSNLLCYVKEEKAFLQITKNQKGIIILYNQSNQNDTKNIIDIYNRLSKNKSVLSINYKLTLVSSTSTLASLIYKKFKSIEHMCSCILLVYTDDDCTDESCGFSSDVTIKTCLCCSCDEMSLYNKMKILSISDMNDVSYEAISKISINNIGYSIRRKNKSKTYSCICTNNKNDTLYIEKVVTNSI